MTSPEERRSSVEFSLDQILDELQARMTQARGSRERLHSLLAAVLSVGRELELEQVLQQILESATVLVDARYGALGVLGDGGRMADFLTTGLTREQVRAIGAHPNGRGVLGELVRRSAPLSLPDLAAHPASVGFPPGHPPMHTFVGAPIRVRGEVFGHLYLTEKRGGEPFGPEDEVVLTTLSVAAGVAIDNARLYREARQRERWLEANAEITARLLSGSPRTEVLDLLVERAREIAEADLAVIALPASPSGGTGGGLVIESAAGVRAADCRGLSLTQATATGGIVGAALRTDEPAICADISSDLLGTTQPEQWRGLGPALAVALGASAERARGVLLLARSERQPLFTAGDRGPLRSFAAQAAVALELAGRRRDDEQLTLLEDRDRIARDLHDLAIQRLFATGMTLQSAGRFIDHGQAAERVRRAVADLDDTVKIIRSTIFGLRAHVTQPGGPGLRSRTVEAVEKAVPALGFTPSLRMEGLLDTDVPPEPAADAVAALCEALGNVARHAHATAADVVLRAGTGIPAELLLTVTDNGRGVAADGHRSGLRNLARRAEHHGGTLTVEPGTAGGTRLAWRVPLHRA